MGFTHIQDMVPTAGSPAGNTLGSAFTVNPTQHNVVLISVMAAFGQTLVSVIDFVGNVYTITPNSPSAVNDATSGSIWHAYLLDAPANADKEIIATWLATPSFAAIHGFEFHATSTAFFDKDIAGNGSGTAVNTPSITPLAAGELLYASVASENGATSANSPWTQDAAPDSLGGQAEYILSSSSGATAVNFTQTNGHWDAMATAITLSLATFVAGDDSQQITVIQQADNVISIW